MSDPIIVQFRAKVTEFDGGTVRVKIPKLNSSHVVQGDRMHYTDRSIENVARAMRLCGTYADLDAPGLEQVKGGFIRTFRVHLGTRKGQRAAADAKAAVLESGRADGEGLIEFDDRAHAAFMEALYAAV